MVNTTKTPVESYYDILSVKPKASVKEVEIAFRHYVARYRPTLSITELFTDRQFMQRLNAFLTLTDSEARAAHDHLITARPVGPAKPELPRPWGGFSERRRLLLTTRIALWRREHVEGIHLLRSTLGREEDFAEGWAMLGEFFLHIDRLEEGHDAYERALAAEPEHPAFAARLAHIRNVIAGKCELQIELSPEEEMVREERRQRLGFTAGLVLLGVLSMVATLLRPLHPVEDALYIPWGTVPLLALGLFLIFLGLSYGRLMEHFEHHMVWTSLRAGDRGSLRSYPYALIIIVTTVPCLWLSVVALSIIAMLDEEWPVGPSIMIGACALVDLLLTGMMLYQYPEHWTGTFFMGGNLLVLAAMFGWWLGSLDRPHYA